MIAVTVAALMATATLLFVLTPLVSRKLYRPASGLQDRELQSLLDQRDQAYDAIQELEFDRDLGKLRGEDYERLQARYRKQAVAALVAAGERESELDQRIEEAVRQRRQVVAVATPSGVAEAQPRSLGRRPLPRRTLVWTGAASLMAALFVTGTVALYLRGSGAEARAIGQVRGDGVSALLVDAGAADVTWAGDSQGALRSLNGGRTWTRLPLRGSVTAIAPGRGGLYALVNGQLRRTTDGGSTWEGASTGSRRFVALTGAGETLYALDNAGVIYTSADGESWQQLARTNRQPHSLTAANTQPPVLYGADEAGVLVLQNGAWSFANGFVNGALPTRTVHFVVFDAASGEASDIPGGGRAEGTLYAATDQGIFKTVDRGSSWIRLGLSGDIRAIGVGPAGSKLLVAVDAAGNVYRSTDRGVSWG